MISANDRSTNNALKLVLCRAAEEYRALLNEGMNQELQNIWNEFGSVSVSLTFQSGKSSSNSATPNIAL
jgi:hypothetical protein